MHDEYGFAAADNGNMLALTGPVGSSVMPVLDAKIPAPPALGLLALAAFAPRRRRA